MNRCGWRGLALVLCLVAGIAACSPKLPPISTSTATIPPTSALPAEPSSTPASAGLTPTALPTPLPQAATPGIPPGDLELQATPSAAPTAAGDLSLLAQYDPWSLGHAVTWSPDGAFLAASAGEKVYLYTGDLLQAAGELDAGTWAASLAFNPQDAHLLALAGRDGTLQIWDVLRLERLVSLPVHPKGANSVAFSPDGLSLASTGNDALVRLWNTAALLSGESVDPQAVMIGGAVVVPAIRFSPDGARIASINSQVVRLREPATQRLAYTLYSDTSMFTIAFSPDGALLAAGELGNQVRLWDLAKQEQIALVHADAGAADAAARAFVWSLDFNPQGTLLAAGSSTGMITVWSIPQGELVQVIPAHAKAVSGLAFDPSGRRLASCGLDAALRIWSIP